MDVEIKLLKSMFECLIPFKPLLNEFHEEDHIFSGYQGKQNCDLMVQVLKDIESQARDPETDQRVKAIVVPTCKTLIQIFKSIKSCLIDEPNYTIQLTLK